MPAVSTRSLCATGKPCSTPIASLPPLRPRMIASSAFAASAMACSATSVTIALTVGFTRSMRARCARMTSRADTCLVASRAASSTAVISHSSDTAAHVTVLVMGVKHEVSNEQTRLWNGLAGNAWVDAQAVIDQMYKPIEDMLVDAAAVASPGRLLDVGCGTGGT